MGDPERYRTPEEIEEQRSRDPIMIWGDTLITEEIATQDELDALRQEAAEEVDAAVEFARQSPDPQPEDLYTDVYA